MENNITNYQDYSGGFSNMEQPPLSPPPPPPPMQSSNNTDYPGYDKLNEQIIFTMVKNMKFVAIWTIVIGAINCLSCIGAVIGIPVIFAGIRLKESAESFLNFATSKLNDRMALDIALEKQSRFFYIYKILIIVGIILFILYIIGIIIVLVMFPSGKRIYNL